MKRNLIILLIVLILIVAAFITFFWVKSYLENSLNDLVNTQIEDVDMSKVGDGKHYGSFSSFPVSVEVVVTVNSHRITEIDIIRHDGGRGKDAESITKSVVEYQSLQVDSVAGATYSSRVILRAIEDALKDSENKNTSS